jgi:hypothetical protein
LEAPLCLRPELSSSALTRFRQASPFTGRAAGAGRGGPSTAVHPCYATHAFNPGPGRDRPAAAAEMAGWLPLSLLSRRARARRRRLATTVARSSEQLAVARSTTWRLCSPSPAGTVYSICIPSACVCTVPCKRASNSERTQKGIAMHHLMQARSLKPGNFVSGTAEAAGASCSGC